MKKSSTSQLRKTRLKNSTSGILGEAPEIILPKFTTELWESDEDMVTIRAHFKDEIRDKWNIGIAAFIKGDWTTAATNFNNILEATNGNDGPAKFLIKEMESYGYKAPVKWKGYRAL